MTATGISSVDVRVDGIRSRVYLAGPRDAPPVVLLHDGAFGTDALLCWEPVITALADQRWVIAPDLPGWGHADMVVWFGQSPYETRIRFVTALRRAMCLDTPTDYVGVSFGGGLVAEAAARCASDWAIRRAVNVSGSHGMFRVPEAFEELARYDSSLADARRITLLLADEFDGIDEHVRRRRNNGLVPGHWQAMMAPRVRAPGAPERAPRADFLDVIGATRVPMLVVAGARDRLLEPDWAQRFAAATPGARVASLDAGHEPNIDRPDELVAVVRAFLDQPDLEEAR